MNKEDLNIRIDDLLGVNRSIVDKDYNIISTHIKHAIYKVTHEWLRLHAEEMCSDYRDYFNQYDNIYDYDRKYTLNEYVFYMREGEPWQKSFEDFLYTYKIPAINWCENLEKIQTLEKIIHDKELYHKYIQNLLLITTNFKENKFVNFMYKVMQATVEQKAQAIITTLEQEQPS